MLPFECCCLESLDKIYQEGSRDSSLGTVYLFIYIIKISQAFPLHFCILQVIKNWRGNGRGMRLHIAHVFPCKHTHACTHTHTHTHTHTRTHTHTHTHTHHTAAHTQPHLETTSGGHWHSDSTRSPGLRVLGGHAARVRGQVGPQKGAAV